MEEKIVIVAQPREKQFNLNAEFPGIKNIYLKKLSEAGFNSLESIAFTPLRIIQEESGIGMGIVKKIINASMKKLNIGIKSADEIYDLKKTNLKITTNSLELDKLLGEGVETGCITEFIGDSHIILTHLMHWLCVNVQLPQESGGIGGNALYIDSQDYFQPRYLKKIADILDLEPKKVLGNVFYGKAYNSDHQVMMIRSAEKLIRENNIKLIVVDFLVNHFLEDYIDPDKLPLRQQRLNQHFHDLSRLIDIFPDLSIIFTNQLLSKSNRDCSDSLITRGGNIVAHGSTIRVVMQKLKTGHVAAKIVNAPHLAEIQVFFKFNDKRGVLNHVKCG